MNTISKTPFKLDINLGIYEDAIAFEKEHLCDRGRRLANKLGFTGTGSVAAANALLNYSSNMRAAYECRLRGYIREASMYEEICNKIYSEDISGTIECW